MREVISFDDVLLVPKYSDIPSRSEVVLSNSLDDDLFLELPVIASPMDTVSGAGMATAMAQHGGMAVLHRYNTVEEQVDMVHSALYDLDESRVLGAAVGTTGDYMQRCNALVDCGVDVLCVDIAHGHHSLMEAALKSIKDAHGSDVHIMAGNVATLEAFEDLSSWGADSIRVGIGGGSICSTRLVTGHGIPTLQSVIDIASQTSSDTRIIADGGIKTTGDMVKALAAGADFVMVGSMLAGTDQSPGPTFKGLDGKIYKVYRGMASRDAQTDWRGKSSTPEGISTTIPYKGPVSDILSDIEGGIKSGLSYTGARDIREFQTQAEFVRQTSASMSESSTHILGRFK